MAPFEIEQTELPKVDTALEKAKTKAKANLDVAVRKLMSSQDQALVLVKDPQFRTVTVSTASGAVILGSVGGAFGTASGIVLGSAAGVVPALFTFGLSLPIGAAVGGGTGLVLGTAAGASVGAVGGGAAGFAGYKYRIQIKHGLVTIQQKALSAHDQTKVSAGRALDRSRANVVVMVNGVKQRGRAAGKFTKASARDFVQSSRETMATEKFQVTAASASVGAVVCGGTGAVVGTTAGAALGLIPALFTFGLSIPVGAVLGGCVGSATGTAAGAAGGGAIGYGGCTYKSEIRSGMKTVVSKVKEQGETAKKKVHLLVARCTENSCTGGTA